jgi:hypothetical protein
MRLQPRESRRDDALVATKWASLRDFFEGVVDLELPNGHPYRIENQPFINYNFSDLVKRMWKIIFCHEFSLIIRANSGNSWRNCFFTSLKGHVKLI